MYNIRVYGLVIKNDSLLVSDEFYKGIFMTKFPGGGHQIGESLSDCLVREFKEELNIDITVLSHFYTTDMYVPSFFNAAEQLISVYYKIETLQEFESMISTKQFDFEPVHGAQRLRWLPIKSMSASDLTYPIDQKVVDLLKKSITN